MLSEVLEKNTLWKAIAFFIRHEEKIHVNGLSKKLKISPGTAHKQLKTLEKEGIIERQDVGNLTIYSLKENIVVNELKKLVFMMDSSLFFEKFIEQNKNVSTLALYGSIAKGRFDKKSDIDLLVISQDKKLNHEPLQELELEQGREVNTVVYTIGEWKKLLENKNNFAESVMQNNIILHGDGL